MSKKTADIAAFYIMSVVGGFFGGYTVIYAGILGAAQSTNIITFIMSIFGRDVKEMLIRLGFLAVFAAGTAATRVIKERCRFDIRTAGVVVAIICAAAVLIIPDVSDGIIALYPIIFGMAFQYNSFTGALGFASSSVFSSNNFRQFVDSATEYICTKRFSAKKKCLFFAGSLFFYHIGVTTAVIGTMLMGKEAAVLAFLPIAISIAPLVVSHRKSEENPDKK